jgi:hypothetical protein
MTPLPSDRGAGTAQTVLPNFSAGGEHAGDAAVFLVALGEYKNAQGRLAFFEHLPAPLGAD